MNKMMIIKKNNGENLDNNININEKKREKRERI